MQLSPNSEILSMAILTDHDLVRVHHLKGQFCWKVLIFCKSSLHRNCSLSHTPSASEMTEVLIPSCEHVRCVRTDLATPLTVFQQPNLHSPHLPGQGLAQLPVCQHICQSCGTGPVFNTPDVL